MTVDSPPLSAALMDACNDLRAASALGALGSAGDFAFELRAGARNVWVVGSRDGAGLIALRAGFGTAIDGPPVLSGRGDERLCEFRCAAGAVRMKIVMPPAGSTVLRCTTSLLPARDIAPSAGARDCIVAAGGHGTVHAAQRGLRSGIVFASGGEPAFSLFYFQDFSSLSDTFAALGRTPAGTTGGSWPELGFVLPSGEDCVLRAATEYVTSDAYLSLSERVPRSETAAAAEYLDRLAEMYLRLPRPPARFRDWPTRAAKALLDVSVSPQCTYERAGRRYLMPYVGDTSKPPESMVQLTALVNTLEYDAWRGRESGLAAMLLAAVPAFYDEKVECLVRWLPGADFGEQAEEHMNHESMDSWYLYHSLFNVWRLAARGRAGAKEILARSLPFAMRVARRFNYQWPIFFNLKNLDVVRAESEPGKGGERDVAGLYALVMLHAHEMFGSPEYLDEARRAAEHLAGYGFALAYQMNTTGFAAEATLRLWKITGERRYLELSELCMANVFDNMWLWRCGYGHAKDYATFFGLFPLHDAPYLAAYEELEAQAKFHDYAIVGGADVRPSLRLLLAEYQKYGLDRGWFYYPDALPQSAIAAKARNGAVQRTLSVPLEDLQDGREQSGQVGQEIYGFGLALVYATRHFRPLDGGCLLYCNYPLEEVRSDGPALTFSTGGDPRGECELRIVPADPDADPAAFRLVVQAGTVPVSLDGRRTPEGHVAFALRGGQACELR